VERLREESESRSGKDSVWPLTGNTCVCKGFGYTEFYASNRIKVWFAFTECVFANGWSAKGFYAFNQIKVWFAFTTCPAKCRMYAHLLLVTGHTPVSAASSDQLMLVDII